MGVLTIISLVIAIVAMIRVKDQERSFRALEKKVELLQQLTTQNRLSAEVNSQQISHVQNISQTISQSTFSENGQNPTVSQSLLSPQNPPISPQISAEQSPQLSAKIRLQTLDESSPSVVTSLFTSVKHWFFGENFIVRVGALLRGYFGSIANNCCGIVDFF